ncbi:hypothetical protein P43SY_003936 [Pythium insidiosum]|uniref:CUE domain-containing protein n=1 Tax=Pythium insidiosum TaxID=114742 RepID=A0AAD5Q617_PYTIN|nr:hypothetical protein P43SY_003936 [Pythium insidiosum]
MELAMVTWEDHSTQVNSLLNMQHLSVMQDIYPTVAMEVLEDVLVAAEFRIDVAVAMLSELVTEHHVAESDPDTADMVIIDSYHLDDAGETQWHDVADSRPELQHWVVVQDDWEVVDGDHTDQPKETSFADIVRRNPENVPRATKQQQVRPSAHASSPRTKPSTRSSRPDAAVVDREELCVKSFGARKRRALRKARA